VLVSRNFGTDGPSPRERTRALGVYVHFPYCLAKCPYCDFTSFATEPRAIPHEAYADAVIAELEQKRASVEGSNLTTIFFGGGTPSLWEAAELGRVLRAITRSFPTAYDLEITAECNPSSLDTERAKALVDQGVNRLSVGVQSLDNDRLKFLGRLHDPDGALASVRAALASGARVSADLIFGVQGGAPQTAEAAAAEVTKMADLGLSHVSAYGLTIEPGTRFGELHKKGKLPIATDDAVMEAFAAVRNALAERGLERYEVSNYARPGEEARHNLGYWRGHDYLGLGCAAVGTISRPDGSARRAKNARDPRQYMRLAKAGEPTESEVEELDAETRLKERIMLGLRLTQGLDLGAAAADLGVDPLPPDRRRSLEKLVRRGAVTADGLTVRVTDTARHLTDGIAAELF
jgi:putative oxygen-independent coproporphyrinogen III oxidase